MERDIQNIGRIKKDFNFLIKRIQYEGELDLRLRGKYFNIYYRGNGLAKVYVRDQDYLISIHEKFLGRKKGKNYISQQVKSIEVRSFFKKHTLDKLCKEIKAVNYSEELMFEQMIITGVFLRV